MGNIIFKREEDTAIADKINNISKKLDSVDIYLKNESTEKKSMIKIVMERLGDITRQYDVIHTYLKKELQDRNAESAKKDETVNTLISTIKSELAMKNKEMEVLKAQLIEQKERIQSERADKEKTINQLQNDVRNLENSKKELEEKSHEIISLENKIKSDEIEIAELKRQLTDVSNEKEKIEKNLRNEINRNQSEFETKRTELQEEIEQNRRNFEIKCRELQSEIDQNRCDFETKSRELQNEISSNRQNFETRLSEKEQEISGMRTALNQKESIIHNYEQKTKDYISLLDKVCGCRSMKDYCEENSIVNDGSIDSVLRFIEIVGTRTSFARTIKNSIERYKKRNGYYPVSDDEIRLIDEVNSFYKNKFGEELSSDVLYFPGDFEKGKVSDVRFQYIQQEMCDYQNSPGIRYASEIYSPCYKSIDIGLDRAMVKGISLG